MDGWKRKKKRGKGKREETRQETIAKQSDLVQHLIQGPVVDLGTAIVVALCTFSRFRLLLLPFPHQKTNEGGGFTYTCRPIVWLTVVRVSMSLLSSSAENDLPISGHAQSEGTLCGRNCKGSKAQEE